MTELGQLEEHYQDFAKRNVRLVVISNDDQPTAGKSQAQFPHLVVVADSQQKLAKALDVIHPGEGPGGSDTNAPTTFLVDGTGKIRWYFRPDRVIERLTPEQLLEAIDDHANKGTS